MGLLSDETSDESMMEIGPSKVSGTGEVGTSATLIGFFRDIFFGGAIGAATSDSEEESAKRIGFFLFFLAEFRFAFSSSSNRRVVAGLRARLEGFALDMINISRI